MGSEKAGLARLGGGEGRRCSSVASALFRQQREKERLDVGELLSLGGQLRPHIGQLGGEIAGLGVAAGGGRLVGDGRQRGRRGGVRRLSTKQVPNRHAQSGCHLV